MGLRRSETSPRVLSFYDGLDATAHIELDYDLSPPRFRSSYKIIEDSVRKMFVEDANGTKGMEVKLKRFELYAEGIRFIIDDDIRKIGHARLRTDAGELIRFKVNCVIPVPVLVAPGFECR